LSSPLCLETCWLGQKTWVLSPGLTLYISSNYKARYFTSVHKLPAALLCFAICSEPLSLEFHAGYVRGSRRLISRPSIMRSCLDTHSFSMSRTSRSPTAPQKVLLLLLLPPLLLPLPLLPLPLLLLPLLWWRRSSGPLGHAISVIPVV